MTNSASQTETQSAARATKECPHCAERILAAAKLCRYCGRAQPLTEDERRRGPRKGAIIGSVIAIAAIGIFCVFAATSYQASVGKLHDANALYASGLTDAEVDVYVRQIANASNISIPAARDVAVVLLQHHVAPANWIIAADVMAKSKHLQDEGVIPSAP